MSPIMSTISVWASPLTTRLKPGRERCARSYGPKMLIFADRARRVPGLQVVWLRFGNTTNASLQAKLAPHWPAIESALMDGESLVEIR